MERFSFSEHLSILLVQAWLVAISFRLQTLKNKKWKHQLPMLLHICCCWIIHYYFSFIIICFKVQLSIFQTCVSDCTFSVIFLYFFFFYRCFNYSNSDKLLTIKGLLECALKKIKIKNNPISIFQDTFEHGSPLRQL